MAINKKGLSPKRHCVLSILVTSLILAPDMNAESNLLEASIEDIQSWLEADEITSVELVDFYLARISAYDQEGPSLNAIQHLNQNARSQAQALDNERKRSGPRSLLHGIPVLVKDNYETLDAPTTAGSATIKDHWPKRDSTQVARLKSAGAIILGKTTMHEFAYGWTTRGSLFGETRNPYDPTRHPGGSSGGTGAAVAANFAVAGMGSDTCGSIRVPSAHNNLVGLRGTRGLSSRYGIIPQVSSRDIGGPLARSTRDLAAMLDATVGYDANDPQTAESYGKIPESYLRNLRETKLHSLRIAVLSDWFGDQPQHQAVNAVIKNVIQNLEAKGTNVKPLTSARLKQLWTETRSPSAFFLDGYEFKRDISSYLQQFPSLPVHSFSEIAKSKQLEPLVARGFSTFLDPRFDSEFTALKTHEQGKLVRTQLLSLLHDHNVDFLVYPTATEEAAPVGTEQSHFNCMLSAASGLPAISVPAGFGESKMPVAIELLAEPWAEQKLLNLAFTIEKLVPSRQLPQHTP